MLSLHRSGATPGRAPLRIVSETMPLFTQSTSPWYALLGFILALLATTAAAALPPISAAVDIDRVVVIVNDDVITETELTGRLTETKKQLALEKIKTPPDSILRKQLLERM